MKRITLRLLAVLITISMCLTLFAGCKDKDSSGPGGIAGTDFIFMPEIISLPTDISDISNLTYSDNKLFFTSTIIINEDPWETAVKIYHMNVDGTNITELEAYVPLSHPNPEALGHVYINSLTADSGGHIWISEGGYFYIDRTPDDFDGESWERWQFNEDLGSMSVLRKLDSTGAEVHSIDLESFAGGDSNIGTFALDGEGNLYLSVYSWQMTSVDMDMKHEVVVLNSNAEELFRIESKNWVDNLMRMADGSIAYMGYEETADRGYTQVIRKIDVAARDWGETVELPSNLWGQLYPGGGDYVLFYQDQNSLRGIPVDGGDSVRLINWIESGIIPQGLDNIVYLPDGRILCINRNWGSGFSSEMTMDLILFSRIPIADLPVRKELTLAAAWLSWELREIIVNFNRASQEYRIKVIDYSEFNTEDDWNAGLTRLTTDIISGNIPDLLDLNGLPYHQYVARDLLVDVYQLIDSDPQLNRSDFMESVFKAAEINGGLYRLFPSFGIQSLVGNPAVLGPTPGWTMTEFRDVLDANPQADLPLGQGLTRDSFVMANVILNMDEYINWATGSVNFDTPDFAMLLEFSRRFPEEIDYGDDGGYWEDQTQSLIASGRQIIQPAWLADFRSIQQYKGMFGGEIVFKGFPAENRNGNSLNIYTSIAITTSCNHIEGAWEFARTIMTPEWQRNNITWMFPMHRAVFNEMVEEALKPDDGNPGDFTRDISIDMPGMPVIPQEPLTQADINQVIAVIESVSGISTYEETLINIIQEGVLDFFSGRHATAQAAARVIQSRVAIYVAEQS